MLSCPQVPTSPWGSSLHLLYTHTQMLQAQGIRALAGSESERALPSPFQSFHHWFVGKCGSDRTHPTTKWRPLLLYDDPMSLLDAQTYTYPGYVTRDWVSCVICVRIHPTPEPMDQLCQHWLGCQIPSDQGITQTLGWWKWSIKWQFGLVFGRVWAFEIELIFTRDNQHPKKEEILPNNVTVTGPESCSWKSLTFRKEKRNFSHPSRQTEKRDPNSFQMHKNHAAKKRKLLFTVTVGRTRRHRLELP